MTWRTGQYLTESAIVNPRRSRKYKNCLNTGNQTRCNFFFLQPKLFEPLPHFTDAPSSGEHPWNFCRQRLTCEECGRVTPPPPPPQQLSVKSHSSLPNH
jgi:hypothetical protein